jgi:formylglycine-generating enzyme required for sulfatase activity
MRIYDDIETGKRLLSRQLGRLLFMTLEHEAQHAETLLYMLLQRAGTGTIPPPGFAKPDWQSLAAAWDAEPKPESEVITLGPEIVSVGHNDFEADDEKTSKVPEIDDYEYGWDLEHPERKLEVNEFKISWRPVTNGEFYEFYLGHEKDKIDLPASWVVEDGVVRVSPKPFA